MSNLNSEVIKLMKDRVEAGQFPKRGLSQEHHTVLVRDAICELIFTDYAKPEAGEEMTAEVKKVRAELYTLLYPLGNISAVRQKMESAGILEKSEGGRKAADAEAIANKWQ